MGPEASAVALLSSAAAMASPLEAWLLQPRPSDKLTAPPPLPPTLRALCGLASLGRELSALPEWPEPWPWDAEPNPLPSPATSGGLRSLQGDSSAWAFYGISIYGGVQVLSRPLAPRPCSPTAPPLVPSPAPLLPISAPSCSPPPSNYLIQLSPLQASPPRVGRVCATPGGGR